MCKLYSRMGVMTKAEAVSIVKEKIRIIRDSEKDGYGVSIHCQGVTKTWQCGETMMDAIGDDVFEMMDDTPRMAVIAMHGRTSTSSDRTVNHSHPRRAMSGYLMHNGVVSPIKKEGWAEEYALDTDYLKELADRNELEEIPKYLTGYAAILFLRDDGRLVVQNQGANLQCKVFDEKDKEKYIEFGTNHRLCSGKDFSNKRVVVFNGEFEDYKELGKMESRYAYTKYANTTGTHFHGSKQGDIWEQSKWCFYCKETGHSTVDCPVYTKKNPHITQEIKREEKKPEAPAKNAQGRTPEEQKKYNRKGRKHRKQSRLISERSKIGAADSGDDMVSSGEINRLPDSEIDAMFDGCIMVAP